jgi:hypothetical protein
MSSQPSPTAGPWLRLVAGCVALLAGVAALIVLILLLNATL